MTAFKVGDMVLRTQPIVRDADQRRHLKVGSVYEVTAVRSGTVFSRLCLRGIPGEFNPSCFEYAGLDCSTLCVGDVVEATDGGTYFMRGDKLTVTSARGHFVDLRNERTGRERISASTSGGFGAKLRLHRKAAVSHSVIAVDIDWNALPLAGCPILAYALKERPRKVAAATVEWCEISEAENGSIVDAFRSNDVQAFRVSRPLTSAKLKSEVRDELLAEFAQMVEVTLEWGVRGPRSSWPRTMHGVRSLLGRQLKMGEDKLRLCVLNGPKLMERDGRMEVSAEFALEATTAYKPISTITDYLTAYSLPVGVTRQEMDAARRRGIGPDRSAKPAKLQTDMIVSCASGEGDTLTIGYDPEGNAKGDGPCVDFTLDSDTFVDIEDLKELDRLIEGLKRFRSDFAIDSTPCAEDAYRRRVAREAGRIMRYTGIYA